MKIITSRDNTTFKELRGLAQDAREIRKQGRTLLDGPHLVDVYRQRMGLPRALVISESGLQNDEVKMLRERHGRLEPLIFKDSLFKELSPTLSPVGVLALIDIPQQASPLMTSDWLCLEGLQDPGNVGTMFRSAAAFGIRHVLLSPTCVGAWTPKVLRAAQGAHFSLAIHERMDLQQALIGFPGERLATVVSQAEPLYDVKLHGPVAWVIGNEGQGISSQLAGTCDRRVTIPITSDCESLNAAVAASICLAEMMRQRTQHDH
ncbi:MAG TPA: RNA methyltransferase [Rhodocyclaceae bacterium]|nr:RNA methyltransferase [Rhodocyclaceae bacterium]